MSLPRAMAALFGSLVLVGVLVAAAAATLPLTWAWSPAWFLYAIATGTAATGLWVVAHECGHGGFCRSQGAADAVGLVLHTSLLVPYFAWQRSHSVHHSFTNHLELGETHVPSRADAGGGAPEARLRSRIGTGPSTAVRIAGNLLLGWPAYLLAGASGGPGRARGVHLWPAKPFRTELFPPRWHRKIWISNAAILAMLIALTAWALAAGPLVVLALYGGPYMVVNMWLVGYTWLHHTDVDIAHLAEPEWSWARGAFLTVDRPYGRFIDLLHHRIGSTHVAHHIDHKIPHYQAARATAALREAFPDRYRFDPTPIPRALWRVGRDCLAVTESPDGWFYTDLRDVETIERDTK